MNPPKIVVALMLVAPDYSGPQAALALAGTVTYGFVEGTGAPNPGEIGATITFLSPPASPSTEWSTTYASDIFAVQIIDPRLYSNGYTGEAEDIQLFQIAGSSPGTILR